MSTEPESTQPTPTGPVVHQFTVLRGMAVALVIETCDWYSGLLHAALARYRLYGQNLPTRQGVGGRGGPIPPAAGPLV
jgi:hypothetical protein